VKQFINNYRKFRQITRQEIGDIREDDLLILFSLFLEQQPSIPLAFGGLESFFQSLSPFLNPSEVNPDADENDDDPFSANTSGV
jgi:hypothetical protein|tara:strand:+ start:187 stop:438 length:252 start_codon:yes stop_codon:yes gene_type:complete